jgi:hypothetical protein
MRCPNSQKVCLKVYNTRSVSVRRAQTLQALFVSTEIANREGLLFLLEGEGFAVRRYFLSDITGTRAPATRVPATWEALVSQRQFRPWGWNFLSMAWTIPSRLPLQRVPATWKAFGIPRWCLSHKTTSAGVPGVYSFSSWLYGYSGADLAGVPGSAHAAGSYQNSC